VLSSSSLPLRADAHQSSIIVLLCLESSLIGMTFVGQPAPHFSQGRSESMFFLKDPFTDSITGPFADTQIRDLASAEMISKLWEISRSKDGPWLSVGKVKGLSLKQYSTGPESELGRDSGHEVEKWSDREEVPKQAASATEVASQTSSGNAASAIGTFRSQFDSVRRNNFASSESLLDVFDWKFSKYLTPWILRVTWVVVLVIAPLLVLLQLIQIVGIWLPDLQWTSDAGSNVADRLDRAVPRGPMLPWWFTGRVAATVWQISSIAGIAVAILWIRVVLELAIVLFNIATTLTTIEVEIKDNKRAP